MSLADDDHDLVLPASRRVKLVLVADAEAGESWVEADELRDRGAITRGVDDDACADASRGSSPGELGAARPAAFHDRRDEPDARLDPGPGFSGTIGEPPVRPPDVDDAERRRRELEVRLLAAGHESRARNWVPEPARDPPA
ncbi:MAG: hypothetical protein ABSB24_13005 [Gaiellaceae bacterium]